MKQAMKSRQADTLSVLRFLLSEIKNLEIDVKHELSDEEIVALLRKEVKRRKEAVDQYRAGGRDDIVSKELTELTLIETFLPAQMSAEAIEQIVADIIAQNPHHDFGQLMKLIMAATQGQADGKVVSQIVRSKLA
jgi:uncharacterized protein YqeY